MAAIGGCGHRHEELQEGLQVVMDSGCAVQKRDDSVMKSSRLVQQGSPLGNQCYDRLALSEVSDNVLII